MTKKIKDMTPDEMMEVIESGTKEQVDAIMNYLLSTGQITLDQNDDDDEQ